MESICEIAVGVKKSPREALSAALSKLNIPIIPPKRAQQIVIKPSIYNPNLPGNTNLKLIQAVVRTFHTLGPISIVESDNPLRKTEDAFSFCNYTDLEDNKVKLVNLSDAETVSVRFPGHYFQDHDMPRILHEDIFFINVATLKMEPDICTVGAGIKNLFGLLPEIDKSVYHRFIDRVLMDLLAVYRPNLTLIDLTDVVVGNRENQNTIHVGGVVAGTDPVAVDAFCSSLLGIDALEINHLRTAHNLGFGEILNDRIIVRGTDHQLDQLNQFFQNRTLGKGLSLC